MDEPQVTLIYHRACSECALVKEALDKNAVRYRARDIFSAPLSREELRVLLEGQTLAPFLNPRSGEYRDRDMAKTPPPLEQALELMARDSRLMRCPILVKGDDVLPVIIPTDAQVTPPEVFAFLGIEVKKPAPKAAAKPHAPAAPKPAAGAAAAAPPAAKPAAEPPKPAEAPPA
jgi:arsenate reductase-like glutaredoxin family protein